MRPWWPQRAQARWSTLPATRLHRARALIHTLISWFGGRPVDQGELLDTIEQRDELPRHAVLETLRALEREGLVRRRRTGGSVMVWVPRWLAEPRER